LTESWGLPTGTSLLLVGIGLVILASGILAPSFAGYWNTQSGGQYGESMSIAPNDTYLKPVGSFFQQSAVQGLYDASVNISADGPLSVQLVPPQSVGAAKVWGTSTVFDSNFTVWRGQWYLQIHNPSSTSMVFFSNDVNLTVGRGYPWVYFRDQEWSIAGLVIVGLALFMLGVSVLRRDAPLIRHVSTIRGYWLCYILPALSLIDIVVTYYLVSGNGVELESNPLTKSLLLTGAWAAALFYGPLIVGAFGLSVVIYSSIFNPRLPRTVSTWLVLAMPAIVGLMVLVVANDSLVLMRFLGLTGYYSLGSPGFLVIMLIPILAVAAVVVYLMEIRNSMTSHKETI
jgi:hypothetical protein